ncbi:Fur family transcriptional regulator [Nocardia alni]|uniref:Fur family transcriptional regulator n=1 Tax=Nocardia alni TaxID=2815723 RepID=UPI001C232A32|nr:Fur family transcriptional regulator [Nocardia alni]
MTGSAAVPDTDRARGDLHGHGDPRTLLQQHGLRCTAPRLAVLDTLAQQAHPGHRSVAEIHRSLIDSGREIDLTTVYRTASTLATAGILHTLALDDRGITYGLADHPHHHAVCTRCGTMNEIPADTLVDALTHASRTSAFQLPDNGGLTLHGLCPNCQALGRSR